MLLIHAHDAAGAYAIRDGQRAVDQNVVYRVGRCLDLVSVQAQCHVPCDGLSCAQLHVRGQVVVAGARGQAVAFLPLFEVYLAHSILAGFRGAALVVTAAAEIVRFVGRSGQDATGEGIIVFRRTAGDIVFWICIVNDNPRIGDQLIFDIEFFAVDTKINAACFIGASLVAHDLRVTADPDILLIFAANVYTAAAVFCAVVGDGAAVHGKAAVFAVDIHTAAAARRAVVGDTAAVHGEFAVCAVDIHTAAVAIYMVAGDGAAVHGKSAESTHLHSRAVYAFRVGDGALALAVGDDERSIYSSAGAVHLDRRTGIFHGNLMTVEAQHDGTAGRMHHPCLGEHNIASQIIRVSSFGPLHMTVAIRRQCCPLGPRRRIGRMIADGYVVCTARAVVVVCLCLCRLHLRGQHTQRRQYQCQQAHQ